MIISRSSVIRRLVFISLLLVVAIFAFLHWIRLPQADALRITKTYISERYDWANTARYDIERSHGLWEITVTAPHDLPTGSRLLSVEIDDKGQIVGFL